MMMQLSIILKIACTSQQEKFLNEQQDEESSNKENNKKQFYLYLNKLRDYDYENFRKIYEISDEISVILKRRMIILIKSISTKKI
jgi:hypothetical protein